MQKGNGLKEATNPDSELKYDLVYTSFNQQNTQEIISDALKTIEAKNLTVSKKHKM